MKFFLFVLILVTACKRDNHPRSNPVAELYEKKKLYCELGRLNAEAVNYNIHDCDSVLHASLFSVACGDIEMSKFLDEKSRWHRDTAHACYSSGRSKTTISKDMFRGLFLYFLKYSKKDLVNTTIDYGKANSWVMGEGASMTDPEVLARVVMTPAMISELYDIHSKLNLGMVGEADGVFDINTGFQAHLDVLAILFRGRLYGGINDNEKDTLKQQAARQVDNALFQFAYKLYEPAKDISGAIALLKNEQYFPANRLPTSADRCVGNLFEHDKNDGDWLPCDQGKTHSGADFVFAVSVLE